MSKVILNTLFLLIFNLFIILPSNVYAGVLACSISNLQSIYNTGDQIQITASNYLYPDQDYDLQLFKIDEPMAGSTYNISSLKPKDVSFPHTVSIPLVDSGHYDIQLGTTIGVGEFAFCARNISISKGSAGTAPTGRRCMLSPSSIISGENLTISGLEFPKDTSVIIYLENSSQGSSKTDNKGSFSQTIKPTFTGSASIPISVVYTDPTTNSRISTSCGLLEANYREYTIAKAKSQPCPNTLDDQTKIINTAIGCIHTEPIAFIKDLLKFLTAIGGGLAFLMMLLGAFQMITSAGNPETLQGGRDRFQSAIIGLLFIIFAVLLLQIIGFDILKLPGFGR